MLKTLLQKLIRLLLYLSSLLTGLHLHAKLLPTDTLTVLQIAQEEGLSQLGASSLAFDNKGYLWVGTQNGLNRFNAYQMKVWQTDMQNTGFPDDHIRDLYYQHDTLWMATNTHSICAYLLAEDRFIQFPEVLNFEKNSFVKYSYTIHPAANNLLLIGTAKHCILFDTKKNSVKILHLPQLLENDFVTSIATLNQNQYLLGTNASGLYVLDLIPNKISHDPRLSALANSQINSLYKQKDNNILIGSDKGLFQFIQNTGQLNQLHSSTVRSIQAWDKNNYLIGGKNENFLLSTVFSWRKLVFVSQEGKELNTDVLAFQQDEQGGKWIGTETRGLLYYHPFQTKFKTRRIQAKNAPKQDFISTFNFLRDADDLWMTTEFGFVKHALKTGNYKLYRTDLLEYTITKDAKGTIWAGGFEQGLVFYNRLKDEFTPVKLPFVDKDIIQITPVGQDSIWIHTWSSGIYALNITDHQCNPVKLFGKDLVRSRTSLVDLQGNIWIGSDDGLYQVSSDRKVKYYNKLSNERVFAIALDKKKNDIWIGTAKGLNRLNPQTGVIKQYIRQAGLPNDFIYSVEIDNKSNVWVSTNFGISMLNQNTQTFKNYTEEDGLQNNEFNGKAGYQDSLGYLYFGGMNGFNIFHPDSIPVNKNTGRTYIERVLLFGNPIASNILFTDTLYFSHNQNVISFEYSNLNYLWSKKNRYLFMLEGFDKQWRPMTAERTTTYTNLAPGTYTFKVRGSNNELLWGDTQKITIIIHSPWYATTIFRAGLILLLILLIAGALMYKNYQQAKTNRRLTKMVKERTEALSKSNKELENSLQISQKQKDNIAFLMQELNHRVKNNLQLITSLIDIQSFEVQQPAIQKRMETLRSRIFTVSKIHDLLNVRDNQAGGSLKDFMTKLTEELMAFSGESILLHRDVAEIVLPSSKLTYLGLILNELITNSIKHAFPKNQVDKQIKIKLIKEEEYIQLVYSDNGIGYNINKRSKGENKGIDLIALLVKELKGQVNISTDKGTHFKIIIPTIYN